MLGNILIWLVIVAAAVLLGWLTFRAWRAKNKAVKWGGVVVSGLFTIVLALVSMIMLSGMVKAYALRSAPVPDLPAAGTREQVARGEHLAGSFCASCHSTTNDLPLTAASIWAKTSLCRWALTSRST